MKIFLAILCLIGLSEAKVFSRCALANELIAKGIPRDDIRDWVCLVEGESGRNTNKKGGPNRNGSFDHGLFQINDKYWCKNGVKGGDCNIKCEDVRQDDITEAVKCALKIKRRHGYNAWYGWKRHCKNKPLANVNSCLN
uniref:lysozyme n=1 Tax=Pristhesancus plagipennis TaxID=1955184 RepID=A0A2K8JM74_PRIPG|nr:secreted Lysozyme-like protein [Pristhesancus plagipennis]